MPDRDDTCPLRHTRLPAVYPVRHAGVSPRSHRHRGAGPPLHQTLDERRLSSPKTPGTPNQHSVETRCREQALRDRSRGRPQGWPESLISPLVLIHRIPYGIVLRIGFAVF